MVPPVARPQLWLKPPSTRSKVTSVSTGVGLPTVAENGEEPTCPLGLKPQQYASPPSVRLQLCLYRAPAHRNCYSEATATGAVLQEAPPQVSVAWESIPSSLFPL